MKADELEKLKYPIGKFEVPKNSDPESIASGIQTIEDFPDKLTDLTSNLTAEELQLKYRPNGWTIKQIVHHCADSHMNSFIRFKLALTEDTPAIKPYFEDKWAEQKDYEECDIQISLLILIGLHKRWVVLLKNLSDDELKKEFIHPEHGVRISLDENVALYAWHCQHHLEHVRKALSGKY